jgi:hypothetical protein
VHITGSSAEAKVYWLLRNNINVHANTVDLFNKELAE